MANNYCSTSSFIELTNEQIVLAKPIIEKHTEEPDYDEDSELDFDWEPFGAEVDIEEGGIWIHGDEINPDDIANLVLEILETLEIDKPFVFSWSYTCSKPRIDEFGGGACAVMRGFDPFWVDAATVASQHFTEQHFSGKV